MKKVLIGFSIFIALLLVLAVVYYFNVRLLPPEIESVPVVNIDIDEITDSNFKASNGSWLKKNDKGSWEMFLQGEPYELGIAFGELTEKLSEEKETAFVSEIQNRIPSPSYLNFLKYMVGWFNRDLDEYVPIEYQEEIYGSSAYMSDNFDFITEKYQRALSYHAAHDIGHMLQNMNLVGCTSFATWNDRSENNKLLIGRNFDFYFGEEFSKDKIIAFYNPESGYKFMSVTWAGFSGVVSGMNEKGLSITLNSAKSEIPSKGKTPVSLIARKILQYASTIEEANTIAEEFDSFVAETFLIGSKIDGKVGLIEKTPDTTSLYLQENNEMIITNHFQSEALLNNPLNQEYMDEGVSTYRYKRVRELMDSLAPLDPGDVSFILRDKRGLANKDIGLANEKAINQLIAHHSVIFSPEEMMAWVAVSPYQLGDYLAYDLDEIFNNMQNGFTYSKNPSIAPDPFLFSAEFSQYKRFVVIKEKILSFIYKGKGEKLSQAEIKEFVDSNENSFLTYYYLADYLIELEDWENAAAYLKTGLSKEIAKVSEREHMEEALKTCLSNLEND